MHTTCFGNGPLEMFKEILSRRKNAPSPGFPRCNDGPDRPKGEAVELTLAQQGQMLREVFLDHFQVEGAVLLELLQDAVFETPAFGVSPLS